MAVVHDQHLLGLQGAVHDALAVQVTETKRDLCPIEAGVSLCERCEELGEVLVESVGCFLHHEKTEQSVSEMVRVCVGLCMTDRSSSDTDLVFPHSSKAHMHNETECWKYCKPFLCVLHRIICMEQERVIELDVRRNQLL